MASAKALIASSWPKTTSLRSRSIFFSDLISLVETVRGGTRAMLETIFSISLTPMEFFRFDGGISRARAPASSMTSIALSGNFRSVM